MSENYFPMYEVLQQNVDSVFRARVGGFSPFTYSSACILQSLIKECIFTEKDLEAFKAPFSIDSRKSIILEVQKRCEGDDDFHLCVSIINAAFSLAVDQTSGYPPYSPKTLFGFLQEKIYQALKTTSKKN